jgi:hypothetical protein
MASSWRILAGSALGVALLAQNGAPLRAAALDRDDDLAVVRRAVAQATPQAAPQAQPAPRASESATPAPRSSQALWLKVRVVEKATKKTKVTVNLPLSLVRAFGHIPLDCHHRHGEADERSRCSIRLEDVLAALDKGQDLVEIDDDEKLVRVWIE